ncbi:class I SAM-dependent methyltransferase [Phragmitibacter flavus]|uniref:Class I SAM-dependent methyltransferase n=1 Tax=Phragmitibacter flavus TaxID=2576071 RepID=A0A5R8KBR8_9BACT|nr:class I SAM-dependent methyltransferase [Phragmitibacter flavus]TLD69752.1 class I SAM-dependent methyltransferase [Phragmitibacter flavus]
MPFPHQDRCWHEVATFVQRHATPNAALLAPDEFVEIFDNVYSYEAPGLDPTIKYDWIIIHKGLCDRLDQVFINSVVAAVPPLLANDVFVVFSKTAGLNPLPPNSVHINALRHALRSLPKQAHAPVHPSARIRPVNFTKLDVEGVREAMNSRYRQDEHDEFGGYEHPHLWDQVRYHEVDRLFHQLIGDVRELDVLEIGCGIGRNTKFFEHAASYLGTDLSDVAIAKAQQRGFDPTHFKFQPMDAMDLQLPDAQFDLVLGAEIIEHVQDSDQMLREVHRVLKPGGRFLFNSANRDSLHLRIIRGMGHPEVRSTYEHFREYGYIEIQGILDQIGFAVTASEGVFIHPYLSIPGIDESVKNIILDDPHIVESLREIGNRAGPEFCFEFMIAATKIPNPA